MIPIDGKKQVHSSNLQLRNTLFLSGRNIEKQVRNARAKFVANPTQDNKNSLISNIGAMKAYLDIRHSLSPTIQPDMAMREQEGLIIKLKRELTSQA